MNTHSILLNVTDLTPQVVTETLYALHQQDQALPGQLHILTTEEGYQRARLLVEIDPKEPDSPLQQWLENGNSDLINWMQQQLTKQNSLKQQAELRQNQEQKRRQAEQQIAEESRLKQDAEQQRLASLSPIDQEIEIFLKPIQAQEHDTRLLQELEKGSWEVNDDKIVAQKVKALMEQAGKWMPDFAGDNKQKVKLKERRKKVLKYLE